jgi:hypothetical protein
VVNLQIEHDFDATERIVMEELGKDLFVGSEALASNFINAIASHNQS